MDVLVHALARLYFDGKGYSRVVIKMFLTAHEFEAVKFGLNSYKL